MSKVLVRHSTMRGRQSLPVSRCIRLVIAATAFSALAGCVSGSQEPVQLGLADPGNSLDQPVHAVLAGGEGAGELIEVSQTELPTGEPAPGIAVPSPSPISKPIQTASVPSQPVQAENTQVVIQTATAVDTNSGATTNLAATVPQDETTDEALSAQKVAFASVEEPEVKQQGFFQRLFQSGQNRSTSSNNRRSRGREGDSMQANGVSRSSNTSKQVRAVTTTDPLVTASASTTITNNGSSANLGNSLPGVKTNRELFGTNEAEAGDEEIGVQVAAVGGFARLSPNGLRVQHEKVQVACLKPELVRLINLVERHYGKKPVITSGYRSPKRNRRAGGVRNSMHIFCKAADIQIEGVSKWKLADFLRTLPGVGGVGTYCRTKSVHLDTGKRRDWHHPCRKSSLKKKKA